MDSNRKSILCLCHDEMTLRVRQLLLEHFGYKVLGTKSFNQVFRFIQENCPDMLLMDSNYPGHDYEETAGRAKALCPDMLAVVLTASYSLQRGGNGNIDHFLRLDDPRDEWLAEIESLFRHQDNESRRVI